MFGAASSDESRQPEFPGASGDSDAPRLISLHEGGGRDSPTRVTLSFFRLLRILLWMQGRTVLVRVRDIRKQSRLLLFVLGSFVLGYLGVGYFLFYQGLQYVNYFPVVGPLLSQRILFLIFGFFFVMLIFSNLITGYSTFFKNRETAWFITLPIPHRQVFAWKFIEAMVLSSWALLFLCLPLMAAFGRVQQVPLWFYPAAALVFVPFVVLPSVLGAWLILFVVRHLSRGWVKKALVLAGALVLAAVVLGVRPTSESTVGGTEDILSFEQLLRHTRPVLSPALPSVWMTRAVLAWGQGFGPQGTFYFLLLASYALAGLLLTHEVAGRFYYRAWDHSMSQRAETSHFRLHALLERGDRGSPLEPLADWIPFLGRPLRALLVKDLRVFWRDPAQWTQFAVFFGLLCIYVLNLRNISFDFKNEWWGAIISYLNLAASALTLSTLTTRFVFPQFSLEGKRLWIIGLAPLGLDRVLWQKFVTSCAGSIAVTAGLMTVSGIMLGQDFGVVVFFVSAITLMSVCLSGVAVGLGALFPNLKEDNPGKIVSGFGGTLCLVLSFIYIVVFIALLALPTVMELTSKRAGAPPGESALLLWGTYSAAFAMSLLLPVTTMGLALRRVRTMEF